MFCSIVYVLSAPCSPFLGFVVDRLGRNVMFVMIAVIGTLGSHVLLGFTLANPWYAMVSAGKLSLKSHTHRFFSMLDILLVLFCFTHHNAPLYLL